MSMDSRTLILWKSRSLLVKQVVQPVLWEKTMRNLLAAGVDKFYEIGPGRVLAGLLKRVERKAACVNVSMRAIG